MRRLWRTWVNLFSLREGGESLAVVRIGAGLCVIHAVIPILSNGLESLLWMGADDGGYRTPFAYHWPLNLLGGPTSMVIRSVLFSTLIAGGCLVVGLGGRLAPLVAGQGLMLLTRTNPLAGGAYDSMLFNLLWLLVLSRSTATLSLDCRLRHGVWSRACRIAAWPRYLILFQLLLLYGSTGVQKISTHWTPAGGFSAVYFILQQPSWQRGDMTWLAHVYPLTQIGTAITWLWEISAPLMLLVVYYRERAGGVSRLGRVATCVDWRKPFALIGLVMHFFVWLLMDLGLFSIIALSMYPCLCMPDEIRGALGRWGGERR